MASNDPILASSLASNQNAAILPPGNMNPFRANARSLPLAASSLTDPMLAAQAAAMARGMPVPSRQQQLAMSSLAASESQGRNLTTTAAATRNPRSELTGPPSMAAASLPLPAAAHLLPPSLQQLAGQGLVPSGRTADLYMNSDDHILSDHQVLLRRQIEFFEAGPEDIRFFTPGRRREISVGQVGIRCKHCAAVLQPHERRKGCVYFPSTLRAIYQAAQNMGSTHFLGNCKFISPRVQAELQEYTDSKTEAGYGGKKYWGNGANARGIYETEKGLRFRDV